jgi:uncharacterized protein YkwD
MRSPGGGWGGAASGGTAPQDEDDRGMKRTGGIVALVLSAWLAFAAAPATAGTCSYRDRPTAAMSTAEARGALWCAIAIERHRHGLYAWGVDRRLTRAARRHARDMVRRRYFGHWTPGGAGLLQRVRRTGYLARCSPCRVGENLHWARGGGTRPSAVVRAWLRSPPHRAILLSPAFREVGIGLARGAPHRASRSAVTTVLVVGG